MLIHYFSFLSYQNYSIIDIMSDFDVIKPPPMQLAMEQKFVLGLETCGNYHLTLLINNMALFLIRRCYLHVGDGSLWNSVSGVRVHSRRSSEELWRYIY